MTRRVDLHSFVVSGGLEAEATLVVLHSLVVSGGLEAEGSLVTAVI